MTAPRDDLIRMVGRVELRADADGDGRTLVGYAAMFDEDTVIDSWEGRFVERIAPGAFKKTLRESADRVKVLFNHGMDPQIGDKPLGKPAALREDERGLWVEVPLDDTTYNRDLIPLLRSGALDGMSFRFSVVKETWDDPKDAKSMPVRTLNEVRLFELGPVTFPAYQATTAGVRSREEFTLWRSLPEEKRTQVMQIIGTADAAAAPGTAADPAAGTTASDPDPVQSARTRYQQWRAQSLLSRQEDVA